MVHWTQCAAAARRCCCRCCYRPHAAASGTALRLQMICARVGPFRSSYTHLGCCWLGVARACVAFIHGWRLWGRRGFGDICAQTAPWRRSSGFRGCAGGSSCAVWEAGRATSAAPLFFEPAMVHRSALTRLGQIIPCIVHVLIASVHVR